MKEGEKEAHNLITDGNTWCSPAMEGKNTPNKGGLST